MRSREVARLALNGRPYHVIVNRFPVTPRHFVVVRPESAPASLLPQCLHGPEDIADMIACARSLGPDHRVYFNSNRGADGSCSGSSVNHWHFQFFPYPHPASPFEEECAAGSADRREDSSPRAGARAWSCGRWPGRHFVLEGRDARAIAGELWRAVAAVHAVDAAYNCELRATGAGTLRAVLVPRRAAPPLAIPGAGTLPSGFGGWEVCGDIVITSPALFRWHVERPLEADAITVRRLAETTREISGTSPWR